MRHKLQCHFLRVLNCNPGIRSCLVDLKLGNLLTACLEHCRNARVDIVADEEPEIAMGDSTYWRFLAGGWEALSGSCSWTASLFF